MQLSIVAVLCLCLHSNLVFPYPQSSSAHPNKNEFWAALHRASETENENDFQRVILNGINVNATDESTGNSVLILALESGFERAAELLIQRGADVNFKGKHGNTAMMHAADKGFDKTIESLYKKGANIYAVNDDNDTALIFAAKRGFEKVADILHLHTGGSIASVVGKHGKTASMHAAERGFGKLAGLFAYQGSSTANNLDDRNYSALLYAAQNEHVDAIQALIARGAAIDSASVVVAAVKKNFEKAVELLVENGARVRDVYYLIDGTTALIESARNGNEKIAKLLIEHGARVNDVDSNGHTALDNVNTAFEGHDKLIQLLEQHGAVYKGVELFRRAAQKACQLYSNLTARWNTGIDTRVFDGSPAEVGEFPWMVALGYLNKQYKISFECGGSLISDTFVLTAAHCVKDIQRPVIARLGKVTLTNEDDFRVENQNIREIILHPKYSINTKKNDIALIRLTDRLTFSEFIQPICLQIDLRDVDTHTDLIVTGWGKINASSTSNKLLKIDLKTMPLFECNANLLEYNKGRNLSAFRYGIDQSQYCAHDPIGRKDSCQGDSGGPLQTIETYPNPAKLVGVVSFGISCGRGKPGIYTRVAHYVEWIGSHVWPNGEIDTPRTNINDV